MARFVTPDFGAARMLRRGDLIKTNYQGGLYRIQVADHDSSGALIVSAPMLPVAEQGRIRATPPEGVAFQFIAALYEVRSRPRSFPAG